MKKLLSLLFIVAILISLISCDCDGAHQFEYVATEEGHCKHAVGTTCDETCVKSPHEDKDNDFLCDYCEYLMNQNEVAQIVLDYEQSLRDEIDRLHEEKPEYIFYFYPIYDVGCIFVLDSNTSADYIIEKYDLKNLFSCADVRALNTLHMVLIEFERNELTEGMYQKIKQISEDETLIEDFFVEMYRTWETNYMPKIEYYTNDVSELSYTTTRNLANVLDGKDIIFKSKEEYDSYLDNLLALAESDSKKESINRAKDYYDEAFFEENALIFTKLIVRSSISTKLTVNNLYVSNDKVYVVVRTDKPFAGYAAVQYATFGFIVNQDDIVGVDEVITLE